MKWLLVVAALVTGCVGDGDGDDDSNKRPDPATCPAEPFEMCIIHDGGWDVWCENGVVFANDMTAHSYCYPGTSEVACTTGGMSISQQYTCATTCATTEKRYFDYFGDYSAFDPATLCTP